MLELIEGDSLLGCFTWLFFPVSWFGGKNPLKGFLVRFCHFEKNPSVRKQKEEEWKEKKPKRERKENGSCCNLFDVVPRSEGGRLHFPTR